MKVFHLFCLFSMKIYQGGDADTTACVAGAMLGCKLGSDAIPASWKDKLLHKDWLDNIIQR